MVKNIVIVGGGSAGWMTAAHMSKKLKGINITLIESPNVPVIGVGESTVPPIVDFMAGLGLEEKDWMAKCDATYKSSICFKDFYQKGEPEFWFPFERTREVANRPVNLYWYHKHLTDEKYKDRYSLFDYVSIVPEVCRELKTIKSIPNARYAYHFDAGLLGEFLKGYATDKGVTHVSDTITNVIQNEDGSIKELERENGPALQADLFIDCSGFRSMLLGKTLKEPYEEFYDYLFNDSAIALRVPYEDKDKEMLSYTRCHALSSGWVWNTPLYSRVGTGYVYCSKYQSKDEAEAEYRNHLGADKVKDIEARHLPIRVGKFKRTWVKNVVAIGLSSGFIEPLESTGIQIVQGEIDLLTEIIATNNDFNACDMAVFNINISKMIEIIRDFLVCHYAMTRRDDTPYWRDVKYNTKIPDSLAEKLSIARANMPSIGNEKTFDTGGLAGFNFNEGWHLVLAGMNFLPFDYDHYKPNNIGPYDLHFQSNIGAADDFAKRIDEQKKLVQKMPSHYQYLKQHLFNGAD